MSASKPPALKRRFLRPDTSVRLFPWVIAVMIFLAALALASAIRAQDIVTAWRAGFEGRLTAQIMDMADQPLAPRLVLAERIIRAAPGISEIRVLPREEVEALLEPWLGRGGAMRELPIPVLIDIRVSGGIFDRAALAKKLESQVPGTRLDDPQPWLSRLVSIARLIEAAGFVTALTVGVAALAMVAFATRAGLSGQKDVISILHVFGARRGYIAAQFSRRIGFLAFLGSILGVAAAYGLAWLAGNLILELGSGLLPALPPNPLIWISFAVLPPLVALFAMMVSSWTVRRALNSYL